MAKPATKPTTNGDNSADSGTQTILIQGLQFSAPAPYNEGHVLSEAEANVLNQTFGENLRNNFASVVKAARTALNLPDKTDLTDPTVLGELTAKFAEYASSYTFSGRRAPRIVADPVEREAIRIAKSIVTEHLAAHKVLVKNLPEGRMDSLVSELLSKRPDIRVEAKRRIDVTKDAATEVLDDLIAKATAPATPAEAEQPQA